MGQKLSILLIVVGCLLMAVGLTLLAAGLTQGQDETIAGSGICAFSFGALACAGGMYLKARAVQAATNVPANKQQTKMRGGCDLCGTESPAVMCRVHQLHLCPACLTKHYDVRSCVYAPSSRRAAAAKAARA
jgi:ribosomal protein S14